MISREGSPVPAPGMVLEDVQERFKEIIGKHDLLESPVSVLVKTLSPEEAIGTPGRRDFPIVVGKERVIEAEFQGAKAQAFTDSPREFTGTLQDVIGMPLAGNGERAVFVATMNAALKHLNIIEATLHCKDEEPEKCASEIASTIKEKLSPERIALVGLNPAILEALSNTFGADKVRATDLSGPNIGTVKFGVNIWDGMTMTEELVRESDVVLLTGTTLINGTFDGIWKAIRHYGKSYLIYGVTCTGVCKLAGLERICPYGRK
jgi:uncharacterized protein (DUF4213/DUF364 family)